jgi:ribosomal protein S12 methylthiotransferase
LVNEKTPVRSRLKQKTPTSYKLLDKVGILSLGCPRNLVDSQIILSRLHLHNAEIVDIQDAQIAIINTCSFIKEATQESIDRIMDLIELKKEGKLKKIIVAGCLASRYKQQLVSSLPEVDAFIGVQDLTSQICTQISLTPAHYSYVKICEGCRNNCSYCVIPKIKPKFVSRPIESILEEILILDRKCVKELILIGQDISQYGLDLYKKPTLEELLRKIVKQLNCISWLRFLYLQPRFLTKTLIKFIADEPRICKYIDLPFQHINDQLLKRMNRKITRQKIINLLKYIRKVIPGVAIRTTFIVGFPGETEKQFNELLDFIKVARFERLGVFIYSREEDTPAYSFKNQISAKIKNERFDKIMQAQQSISEKTCKQSIGEIKEVIIDEKCADSPDTFLGRSSHDAPEVDGCVYVKAKGIKIGEIIKVKIVDSLEYDLVGEEI